MQTKNFLIPVILSLVFISCKKENNSAVNSGDGNFQLDTIQYNITSTERTTTDNYFVFSGSDLASPSHTMQVFFSAIPTASNKFEVVNFQQDVVLDAYQVGIRVNIPSNGIHSSTGIASNLTWLPCDKADVTVNNGKIKIVIPPMTTAIPYVDSSMLHGMIEEN